MKSIGAIDDEGGTLLESSQHRKPSRMKDTLAREGTTWTVSA